jgi:hypothetical protein
MSEVFKEFSMKQFCKYINNMLLCANILQFHILFCDLLSQEVILYWNVFCFGMNNRIFRDIYCTSIVTQYFSVCFI